jgi:hypothetical protein
MKSTCGKKLHADRGRFDTSVNISPTSRCCTLVSCEVLAMRSSLLTGNEMYQLGVELCETQLSRVVED